MYSLRLVLMKETQTLGALHRLVMQCYPIFKVWGILYRDNFVVWAGIPLVIESVCFYRLGMTAKLTVRSNHMWLALSIPVTGLDSFWLATVFWMSRIRTDSLCLTNESQRSRYFLHPRLCPLWQMDIEIITEKIQRKLSVLANWTFYPSSSCQLHFNWRDIKSKSGMRQSAPLISGGVSIRQFYQYMATGKYNESFERIDDSSTVSKAAWTTNYKTLAPRTYIDKCEKIHLCFCIYRWCSLTISCYFSWRKQMQRRTTKH